MHLAPPIPPPDAPPVSIPVGITIGLLASFVQSLGLTIQRKSHVMNERKPEWEQRVEHRRPLWLLGFGIFIVSNILGSLFQIASLPVVILAPLGAVSLLWNAFFARLLLGDVFSPYMIFGTIAIAGGAVMIAVFGIVPEPTHSLENLLVLFSRKAFVVYFSLLGTAVAGGLAIVITPPDTPPPSPPLTPLPISQSALPHSHPDNVFPQPSSERTPLLQAALDPKPADASPPQRQPPSVAHVRLLLAVSYASASGILSGMCLLFAKSGVELLILTAKGDNQFWRWEAWALVGGLVVFALLQLWYLHKSLVLANPILVCPLAFCFYNLSSIVNGLVYYDQFGALTTLHLYLVILGIFVLLGGVWAVSFTSGGGGGVEPGTWHEGGEAVAVFEQEQEQGLGTLPTTPSGEAWGCPPTRRRRARRYATLLGTVEGQPSSLGGLSIGLSPVSPGFALRPRRRPSGNALAGVVGEVRMRRTVSEADVGPEGAERRARARWRWLRGVWREGYIHDIRLFRFARWTDIIEALINVQLALSTGVNVNVNYQWASTRSEDPGAGADMPLRDEGYIYAPISAVAG
ncbi:hypothetical protein K439DRAFT_1643851 [Ramaria rubella]|nr:hypothetical protein K439DRAFT_1643851 [Ramaria rubella]